MYKKILFVEDEQAIAQIYADILRSVGYEVDLAYDGNKGFEQARSNTYDLILLDLMLPYMSGTDILKALRDKQRSPDFNQATDIVMLTNFDVDTIQKKEILSLAQAYLLKVNTTPKTLVEILRDMSQQRTQPA